MQNYLQPQDDGLPTRLSGNWAAIKLDYLARYINMFETAMRDKWAIRNYIDLLAGPGKNRVRNSKTILLGSPLLALNIPHPFTGYYFVDKSARYTAALKQRCTSSPFNNRVDIRTGDCNELVNDIVARLIRDDKRSLNLAFLDPSGLELHWTTVAKLASLQRLDLIIYYSQMGFKRYMRMAYRSEGQTAVDLFFGSDNWREVFGKWENKPELHRALIDLYKTQLGNLGYTEVFRGDEYVGDEPLIRNQLRNVPLYRLLFASKHNLGHKFWREVVRRDIYGQGRLF